MRLPKTIPIYGDTNFRDKNCRLESTEQKEFFGVLKERYPHFHRIAIHPKNEGRRTHRQAQVDKESGALNLGASDIIIPARVPFACELKRVDHTLCTISKAEIEYLESVIAQGGFGCIALGSDAVLMALEDWFLFKSNI